MNTSTLFVWYRAVWFAVFIVVADGFQATTVLSEVETWKDVDGQTFEATIIGSASDTHSRCHRFALQMPVMNPAQASSFPPVQDREAGEGISAEPRPKTSVLLMNLVMTDLEYRWQLNGASQTISCVLHRQRFFSRRMSHVPHKK